MTCQCCNGDLPDLPIWEARRSEGGECTGSVDSKTGRCKAFVDDRLWSLPEEDRDEDGQD